MRSAITMARCSWSATTARCSRSSSIASGTWRTDGSRTTPARLRTGRRSGTQRLQRRPRCSRSAPRSSATRNGKPFDSVPHHSGAGLRSLRAEVEETERVVHELEARLAELRTKLADPSLYTSEAGVIESRRLDAERIEVEKQLEHAFARWAEAGDALAEAEAAN